jgi:hypothetical protein
MTAQRIRLEQDRVLVGERAAITFQRTLRLPDDGRPYPLPPGLGRFPVRRAADYPELPLAWRNDFLVPMYRREALWLGFEGASWKPNAVKVGLGGIDAVSGQAWDQVLQADPQNYVVVPDQPWLDGINSGGGTVRQFVAIPLGEGKTVEAQLTGQERTGGIQLAVYEPLPGRFPEVAPAGGDDTPELAMVAELESMGIGAGGMLRQKVYPDHYGVDTWDPNSVTEFFVRLLSVPAYCAITGEAAPSTPVDATAYTAAGLPWFELDDEEENAVAAAQALARIRSIRELEHRQPDQEIDVTTEQTRKLRRRKT